jgi:ribose transport system ATP-binding protein
VSSEEAISVNRAQSEILCMEGISKVFPGVQALKDVTFCCLQGESHALVGENGAGKSTLIKILSGVFPPNEGEIRIAGRVQGFRGPQDAQEIGIRVVPQEFSLVPYLSVAENLFLGMERLYTAHRLWFQAKTLYKRAREMLDGLGLPFNPRMPVYRLSVAQQKWLEIAKALVAVPEILVLDEPTAPLSDQEVEHLFAMIKDLKKQGTTLIYISHRLDEIFQIADRVTVLKDGEKVGTRSVHEVTRDEVIRMMIGRQLGELFPPKPEKIRKTKALEIRDFCAGDMVRDVSLDLFQGEILGIGGLQGNGQDALLKALFGTIRWDSGEVRLAGKKIKIRSPRHAVRREIALVTEKKEVEGLCMVLPIRHNMSLPTLHQRQRAGLIQLQKETAVLEGMAHDLAVHSTSLSRAVGQLSGGNKQKVIVGKWLIADPKVIMFVDPTMGIDVATKQQLYLLLRNLADEQGKGIILVLSEMMELLGLCDRIAVMREGRVVTVIEGEKATEENIMRAAMGLYGEAGS